MISKEQENYISSHRSRKRKILITQISILVVFILLWEVAARLKWIDTFLTSSPSAIYHLFISYLSDGSIFKHIGISVSETMVSFIIGTALGILVAIVLWWSDFLAVVLDPYLVVLNGLPKTALAPIIIIWAGAGYTGIIITAITLSIVLCFYSNISKSYNIV